MKIQRLIFRKFQDVFEPPESSFSYKKENNNETATEHVTLIITMILALPVVTSNLGRTEWSQNQNDKTNKERVYAVAKSPSAGTLENAR